MSFEKDIRCGFSWPQRNYSCSFCKKEFKSAQALGGHMNVHRRDRAKMIQSPSWDFPNPNPNPNPYPNPNFSSSSAAKFLPYTSPYHNTLALSLTCLTSPSSATTGEQKMPFISPPQGPIRKNMSMGGGLLEVGEFNGFLQEKQCKALKKKEISGLGLSMDLLGDTEDDLDLELRLGCS